MEELLLNGEFVLADESTRMAGKTEPIEEVKGSKKKDVVAVKPGQLTVAA